jgi:hypothetical protein
MTLVRNKYFYIYCWETNGATRLKSSCHDAMSGEHVGTTSGMNVTNGKSRIWPLVAFENQVFVNMWKLPRGKYLGTNSLGIYSIWEEAGCCVVCWGKEEYHFLLWKLIYECEARRNFRFLNRMIAKEEFWSSPSWIHGQTRGWTEQVDWRFCSMVGRNLVVPFVIHQLVQICPSIPSLVECSLIR